MGSAVLRLGPIGSHLLLGIHERLYLLADCFWILCEPGLDFRPSHMVLHPGVVHLLRQGPKSAECSRRQPTAALQIAVRSLGSLLRPGVLRLDLVDQELQCLER